MKFYKVFKFIILFSISSGLYAQDFYAYKLFDNQFQAVFPEEPKQFLPGGKVSTYRYSDPDGRFSIIASSSLFVLDKNIVRFEKNSLDSYIKKDVQAGIKNMPLFSSYSLIDFSSSFDKKKNMYIATHTFSFLYNGSKMYQSTKKIIQSSKEYKWSVKYINLDDKYIFDGYEKYSKILKQ